MKIKFENLGPLEFGEINIADLTVICGENNTGKTYVTYLIYCLLTSWCHLIDVDLKQAFVDLQRDGVAKIDLKKQIAAPWEKISTATLKKFVTQFPEMLASKSELFAKLKLTVDFPLGLVWQSNDYENELRSAKENLLITLKKPAGSTVLELAAPKSEDLSQHPIDALSNFIEERILGLMLQEAIPRVFIASTERTGATTFKKQLNLATSNLIDLLSQAHKEGADSLTPNKVFEAMYGKPEYAIPVRHNVQFLNQLPNATADEGALFKKNPNILKAFEAIVGGTYVTNKEGVTNFQPKGTSLKLGLGEVSSSVRSLLIVWYWLKYYARPSDLLIMDEPELNLHPANQRRLARFIATLVNSGIKVFITTHSDTIIKEFNTLIMLHQASPKLPDVLAQLKDYTANDKLDPARMVLYMAREEMVLKPTNQRRTKAKTLVKTDISPTLGVEARSFDDTIEDMNAVQEAIYYGLH